MQMSHSVGWWVQGGLTFSLGFAFDVHVKWFLQKMKMFFKRAGEKRKSSLPAAFFLCLRNRQLHLVLRGKESQREGEGQEGGRRHPRGEEVGSSGSAGWTPSPSSLPPSPTPRAGSAAAPQPGAPDPPLLAWKSMPLAGRLPPRVSASQPPYGQPPQTSSASRPDCTASKTKVKS